MDGVRRATLADEFPSQTGCWCQSVSLHDQMSGTWRTGSFSSFFVRSLCRFYVFASNVAIVLMGTALPHAGREIAVRVALGAHRMRILPASC